MGAKQYKEQFDRYKAALDNLIITDYLTFEFYITGERIHEVCVGTLESGKVVAQEENFARLAELLIDFCTYVGQTIKSAQRLAVLMAGKARLLENTLYQALTSDEESNANTDLREQFNTFKTVLIHDLTPTDFADIYAQTLAYGMFAARLHDETLDTFSRQEAAELIPRTNPFLRRLFDYVAGVNIDERIKPTVDNLVEVFRATDVAVMLKDFGKTTQTQDPIIHFYETFLAEYNPKLRKQRGVWYTPEPVVQFIVRAVDDILKSEFDLADGIADTSKIEIETQTQTPDSRTKTGYKMVKELVHKVQILDPATGTGTFLAAIIQHIFHSQFENMGGVWSSYVEQDLLPRLHGFELLMASYAMAHLKLDMLLTDTGYQPIKPKRLQVYLTNSLEEHNADTGTLFAGWLSAEANEANAIKRDAPVMVVMGNPPYAVSSTNKGEWIEGLMTDYKKDLNERNIQPLSDDYIKFIRYGQHYIEKNGEGILAFITNNSFIDGIVHRQMRKSLLETFDKVYILDLHGNSRKQETAPDGGKDENVFDIMAGVSINIFVKENKTSHNNLAEIFLYDLYGRREEKYSFLNSSNITNIDWTEIITRSPNYEFVNFDYESKHIYEKNFSVNKLFITSNTGVETGRDAFFIDYSSSDLREKIKYIFDNKNESKDLALYDIKNTTSFKFLDNLKSSEYSDKYIKNILYRPFDTRAVYYDTFLQRRPRFEVMKHLLHENLSITATRSRRNDASCYLICNMIVDKSVTSSLDNNFIFPLYLYPEEDAQTELLESKETPTETPKRVPNLDPKIVADIASAIGLTFTVEKTDEAGTFAPIDILDYIYAVLHSPTYRETYKEFLKIDFPRVPYPSDVETFWQLVALGSELRQIHLLESPQLKAQIKTLNLAYPKQGDNSVIRKMTTASIGFEMNEGSETIGKVWINDEQYFDNVPLIAWEFYIGGYQPAQKWLKDRRERSLDHNDVAHYMNIIAALSLTDSLMQQIDAIDVV